MSESEKANIDKLNKTINELEKQSRDLKDFNSVYAEIAKLKQDILENLKLLKENNKGLSEISKKVEQRLDESQKKIDEFYNDNKAFQKELDSSIASRLDKHKSDIQVEIRNEGTQIQRSFETTLHSSFNQMESKLKSETEKQTKKLNTLKILSFILIAISIGLAVGLFVFMIK
jgi:CHASE3 domain sensor protein